MPLLQDVGAIRAGTFQRTYLPLREALAITSLALGLGAFTLDDFSGAGLGFQFKQVVEAVAIFIK